MKRHSAIVFLIAYIAVCQSEFINNPPISGKRPEYTIGTAK